MFHAAGRKIYQRGPEDYVALQPTTAEQAGLRDKEVDVFHFVPIRARVESGDGEPKTPLAAPEPGKLAAAYWGRTQDRVGTGQPEPDGRPDCCVRTLGVEPDRPIKNIVLTGPKEGRWEYVETGRWWRLAYERKGRQLDGWFQFYASGEHQIEIVYEDGSRQSARFQVPNAAGADYRPN